MTATISPLAGLAGVVLGFGICILGLYFMRASSTPSSVRGFARLLSMPFLPPLIGLGKRERSRYYLVYGAVLFTIGLAITMLSFYLLTPGAVKLIAY